MLFLPFISRAILSSIPFLLLLSSFGLFGQRTIDFNFTRYTVADGLSSDYVRNIYQDSRGLIWICTTDGLNRYDGKFFKIYKHNPADPNSLPGNDIWSIAEDQKGNFWVGTQTGMSYFEPAQNRFTNFRHEPGNLNSLADARAAQILIDTDNHIWIATLRGLQMYDPLADSFQTFTFVTKEEVALDADFENVRSIYLDNKQQLWVLVGGTLYLKNKEDLTFRKMIPGHLISSFYQDTHGQYWLGYWGKGFVAYDGLHQPEEHEFFDEKDIGTSMTTWIDIHKTEWLVIASGHGISLLDLSDTLQLQQKVIAKATISSIAFAEKIITDQHQNIWISTNQGIMVVEPAKQFFEYYYLRSIRGRDIAHFLPEVIKKIDNHFWLGFWFAGGMQKLDHTLTPIKEYEQLPLLSRSNFLVGIDDLHRDSDLNYWIASDTGLIKFNEITEQVTLFKPDDVHPNIFEFKQILPIHHHRILIRSRNHGIYIFNTRTELFERHIQQQHTPCLPHQNMLDMAFDSAGDLWIATENGVCRLDTTTFRVKAISLSGWPGQQPIPSGKCRGIEANLRGHMWIGTEHGLYRWSFLHEDFHKYNTLDGLCNNTIMDMLVDKNDNVWMITQNGLSIYNQRENQFRNFYKQDGLPQNALEGELYEDADGRIYISDPGKILIFNPDLIPFNKRVPDVIIIEATLNESPYTILLNSNGEKCITTNFNNNSFTVQFAILNFNSSHLNTYYYQLEGEDDHWHKSDRGLVSYSDLHPGCYTLHVKGSNNSGIMNETGDFIRIMITPEWYQTLLFKTSCALAFTTLLFLGIRGIYQYRLQHLQNILTIRNKIAKDLHDEIGSTLGSISFNTEAAVAMEADQLPAIRSTLKNIGLNSRKAIENMSDIVWAVNPANDSFMTMINRLETFASKMLQNRNIEMEVHVTKDMEAVQLNPEQRKNIYLILREAVHNIAKYSQATVCCVTANRQARTISIEIKDNGTGFDAININPGLGGNGLSNMKQRAEELRGILTIDSQPQRGTTISLQFNYR